MEIERRTIIPKQKISNKYSNIQNKGSDLDSNLRTIKNFFQNLPLVIYSALPDEKSTTIFVTDAIKDITGYIPEEFYKNPELWVDIIYNKDKDEVWKAIEKHRKDKSSLKLNYRIITKSGNIKWLKDEAAPVFNKNRQIIRIDGIIEDITELKKIRDQIIYQSTLVDNVSDAIISMNLDFKILSWNTAAEKIYGWTEKEVIGKRLVDLVNPKYKNIDRNIVIKKFKKTGHWTGKIIQMNKNGDELVIHSSGSYIKGYNGKPIGVVAVNRDITKFKKFEKKIEDLSRFPSENPSPVFRVKKNGVILYANEACKSILDDWGCCEGEKVPNKIQRQVHKALISNNISEIEINSKNQDLLFKIVPIIKSDYVNFYGTNITAIKKAEKIVKQSEERFRLAQIAAEIGSWDWDIITGDLEWSETIEPLFGFKKGKFGKTYDSFLN